MNSRLTLHVRCLAVIPLLIAVTARAASDADDESRFVDGLRRRGLYSLVESYCLDQLSAENLPAIRDAQLRLELSRTYLAHAGQTLGDERTRLRKQALETATAALDKYRSGRWGAELLLQTALISLEQAQFDLTEFRMTPSDPTVRERAVASLQAALTKLKDVGRRLERERSQIRERFRMNPRDISPFQHSLVQKETDYLIARTMCDLAELEIPDLARRTGPLKTVQERIRNLTRDAEDESTTWESRLLLLRTFRLLNDFRAATGYRDRKFADLPASLQDGLIEEDARLALDRGRPDEAAAILHEYRKSRGALYGSLSLLNLQVLSAMWDAARAAEDNELARQILDRIRSETQRAQIEVGGIWAWRCSRYLKQIEDADKYGPEIAARMRAAQTLFQSGDKVTAADRYAELAALAEAQQQPELVPEMLFTEGSIRLQLKDYRAAAEVFGRIGDKYGSSERAPQAHLLRAYCLGKLYEAQPTQSNRERYTAALDEHIERYPESQTWGDALMMRGQLEERRLQVTKALQFYARVPDNHPKAVQAHLAVVRCYDAIFARLKELGSPADAWQKEAVTRLKHIVLSYPTNPAKLSLDQVTVVIRLAKLLLEPQSAEFAQADALLAAVDEAARHRLDVPASTRSDERFRKWETAQAAARQLRIISLASRGRSDEARQVLNEVSLSDTGDLLNLLNGLSRVAEEVDARTARGIGELQLQASLALRGKLDQLTPAQRDGLAVCLAQAYEATARRSDAIAEYRQLVTLHPNDRTYRRSLAELLMKCGTSNCLRQANEHWTKLAAGTSQGTHEWFALRKEIIACLAGTNQTDEAARLLRVTQQLYPELGGEPLKGEFLKLKAQLKTDQPDRG